MANMYPSKKAGGGGAPTETTLWTNSNPSYSVGFSAQTVTLSQSIDNFDYIEFRFAAYYANLTDAYCMSNIYSKEDVRKAVQATQVGSYMPEIVLGAFCNNQYYGRNAYYISDTQIYFETGSGIASSNSSRTCAIPLSIVGIKYT